MQLMRLLGGHNNLKNTAKSNMHMNIRVTADIELNFEVKSVLQGHYHCCPLVYRALALLF